MLAFTIQFPNNNPAPPQQHPKTNTNQRPASIQQDILAANTGQTPKHQEPLTQANTTKTLPTGRTPATIHQERRLVASKPNSMPNHTNHTTPTHRIPAPQEENPLQCVLADAQAPRGHSQYPAPASASTFSGIESIDIPPMSNPPGQHSCPAWATNNG